MYTETGSNMHKKGSLEFSKGEIRSRNSRKNREYHDKKDWVFDWLVLNANFSNMADK
jgi:hypothetical protein